MDKKQREELTALIEEEGGKNWWIPDEFEAQVRVRLPIGLIVIAPPPPYSENYNCFVFAFGLEHDPEFLGGQNPIQQEFVKYLLDNDILTLSEYAKPEDYIFYNDEAGNITHGGILKSKDVLVSKWMWGPIIEGSIWDVPSSFGNETFICNPINPKLIKAKYQEYKDTGVEVKPIE